MKASLVQLSTQPLVTEREWTEDGIPVLTASCSLPQPVKPQGAAARRVRRYYQLQRRCFFRYCETWLLPQARAEYHAALAASRPLPCFRAELGYRVTWNQDGLWSLYTHTRETCPGSPPLLGRRGDRPAGSRRGGPLPRPLAAGPAAAFQPPELLSDGGRPGFLLSHVRHRSRRGGNAGVHSALRHAGPPAAGSANAAIKPARRLRAGPETSFLICGGPCSGHGAARGCGPSARPPAAPSRWGCAQNV